MEIINVKMMMHPMNWFLVWIVIMISSFAWREIHKGVTSNDSGVSPIPD